MTVLVPSLLTSCAADDEDYENFEHNNNDLLRNHIFNGEYVMFTKVTVNDVDKTLLDDGCPTRVAFSWDMDSLQFNIPEMKIGNMPFAISFRINCAITELNSWEVDEHLGGNSTWVKFEGSNGYVSTGGALQPNGSSIKGFYNIPENIVEFEIDYNVMNVRTICERQNIDLERVRDYDSEMKKYMEALSEIKKDNGLNDSYLNVPGIKGDDVDFMGDVDAIVSLDAVKGMLDGNIVLDCDVKVASNSIVEFFPTIVNFSWTDDVMTVKIEDFQAGKMPFTLNFKCDCKRTTLDSSEALFYPTSFKFVGTGGVVSSSPSLVSGNEGTVECYFDPFSMQIFMYIDLGTASTVVRFNNQTIDFSRIDNYNAELNEYFNDTSK